MSNVVEELAAALKRLDPEVARRLERVVRAALELVEVLPGKSAPKRRPADYFERTAGSFRDEPLERPEQLPFEKREEW